MIRLFCSPLLMLLFSASTLSAARPPAEFGGSKQLDITLLEKALKQKFSIPFPAGRFDIDYFYKGDLAQFQADKHPVLASCPYVVGPMIAFSVGTGDDAASYKPELDVAVDLNDDGSPARVHFPNFNTPNWPKSHEVPNRQKGEAADAYLTRAADFWKTIAARPENPAATSAQTEVALRIIAACLAQ